MTSTVLLAGGYTDRSPAGIRVFDGSRPEAVTVVEGIEHPSFLAVHPNGAVVYAVSETTEFDGRAGGGVVALRFDRARRSLVEIDRLSSGGDGPCHVAVDRSGTHVFVANYGSGSIAAIALMHDGRFGATVADHQHAGSGPHDRQDGPHAHCVRPGPDGRTLYAVDLGIDSIIRYERQGTGSGAAFELGETVDAPPGAGPRHIAFHPAGRLAAVVNELENTLAVYGVSASGRLEHVETQSCLPPAAPRDGLAADVRFDPDGRRVYVSNRGHDSIAVFAIEPGGSLTLLAHTPSGGRTPRCMGFQPDGQTLFVANQDSDRIVSFAVDANGLLTQLDDHYEMASPTCVVAIGA